MLRRNALLLVGLAVLPFSRSSAPAQTPPSAADPASLLDSARQKNGLNGPDVRPWHIHGNYKLYDDKGKIEDEGVYEEWWLSPTKYKVSFASPHFAQTDYAIGDALLRDGAQEWANGFEYALREQLISPLPLAPELTDFHLEMQTNKTNMRCVSMVYPIRPGVRISGDFFPVACFEPAAPILRVGSLGNSRNTIYNQLVSFEGHYVAKQLQVVQSGKLRAELDVDTVESWNDRADSALSPPSTAKLVNLAAISFPESSSQAFPMALRKAIPEYPQVAKSMRIVGTVRVRTSVSANGHVSSTKVIDGPPYLRQAAEDAVKQWIYRPPMLLGAPRPFEAEVKVIFNLG